VSVISVDVLQAVFLIAGGLSVCFIGVYKVGGWNELIRWTPQENIMYTTAVGDPGYPAIGMWMGISIIIAAFYMMHQGVLQKCLAARSMNGTRLTMLVYGLVLLPLGCLFTGTPGLITRALVEKGIIAAPDGSSGYTISYLLDQIIPHGVLGLVVAGYMAAMISTTDSYINSATTVFINDIYSKVVKGKDDKHYLRLARIVTYIVAIGIPFVFVQYFMKIPYLMAAFYSITSAVVPGVLIAVILGMGTKWFKAKAATASIIASIVGTLMSIFWPATFLAPFCIGISYTDPGASWFQTVAGFVWGAVFAIIFSFLPERRKNDIELFGLVMNHPKVALAHEAYFYGLTKNFKGIDQLPTADKEEFLKRNKLALKKGE
jgi:SSS family solute:Na+ symporter